MYQNHLLIYKAACEILIFNDLTNDKKKSYASF